MAFRGNMPSMDIEAIIEVEREVLMAHPLGERPPISTLQAVVAAELARRGLTASPPDGFARRVGEFERALASCEAGRLLEGRPSDAGLSPAGPDGLGVQGCPRRCAP